MKRSEKHAIEEDTQIIITCRYKTGMKGIVFFNEIDKENDRPYSLIGLADGKIEVFFEGEFKEDKSGETFVYEFSRKMI